MNSGVHTGCYISKFPWTIWASSCCCPRTRRARRRGRRAGATVKFRKLIRDRTLALSLSTCTATVSGIRLSCLRPILPASPSQLPAFAPVFHCRPLTSVASVPVCSRSRSRLKTHRQPSTSWLQCLRVGEPGPGLDVCNTQHSAELDPTPSVLDY
ncbi:hypothetical protein AAFF_G00182490 [Aldrovandia affinis]|uniref:Uncharacterized protein n=1 Tax=Aldrovandia affinis TaxID=143900 RepID=A0AAD7RKN1_9TELE|nr:hypothetical protein AAFF_G00182490 [Aldrovandia affinis]